MRVLVACEFSGVVRNAFLARGHDAWSCDLLQAYYLPSNGRHIRGDVRSLLREEWDLVIAHPPCTFLTNASAPFLKRVGRRESMKLAAELFRACLSANSPRVCVENPTMLREAVELIGVNYSQAIHPWQFGHWASKRTCLWLKGLPLLEPTNVVDRDGISTHGCQLSPGYWRGYRRSITFKGIARAMAEQWGGEQDYLGTKGEKVEGK